MKIFSTQQIHNWDAYTIMHEPVLSIDLMERAAIECFLWIKENVQSSNSFIIICGTGNNGGDGLALARMLCEAKYVIQVYILEREKRTTDFATNLERLIELNIDLHFINAKNDFPVIKENAFIIDALFGSGLNRPLEGLASELVQHINHSSATTISIDIPSGLFADKTSKNNIVIRAKHTLSFQVYKLAFMLAENEPYIGNIHLMDIRLSQEYYAKTATQFSTIDELLIKSIYKPRDQFSHKYNFGHALLYVGSKNMIGAAILCAKAVLRTGAGLVTIHTAETQSPIQIALPEAITTTENDFEKTLNKKNAVGIGPGLEASALNSKTLKKVIDDWDGPLVIDATALSLLAEFPEHLLQRKKNPAILTPHNGEFENLFGKSANDFERIQTALEKAKEFNCFIVLKGHFTFIASPDGKGFFNTTGNAGMATAGSGDVLTGMVTSLLAQGYSQLESCLFAVYLHGLAGDIAAEKFSQEAMISGDIVDCIGEGFKKIQQ